MAFLKLADRMRIIIRIMPPHSTHRVQPLDIGMFGPLSIAYTKQLNQLQHSSLGLVSMTKRFFYPLFRDSWKEAFTADRIQHAFEKAGIWPLNPERTIGPLRRPTLEIASPRPNLARTPLMCRITRRAHREYKKAPSQKGLELIFCGHEQLAAKDSINQHIIKGLQQSLQLEKRKRQRGKRLNLIGEEDHGPQFFTPERVRAAIEYQAEREREEETEKQTRIDNRARKALEKEDKEIRKQLAREERLRKREEAQSEKLRKARERTEKATKRKAESDKKRALIQARKAELALNKARLEASKALNKARETQKSKRKLVESNLDRGSVPVAKRAIATNSRGRPVIIPARYA